MTNGTQEKKPMQTIAPAVDILETPTSYVVTMDIPGSTKDHIIANIDNDTLVVSADVAEHSCRAMMILCVSTAENFPWRTISK